MRTATKLETAVPDRWSADIGISFVDSRATGVTGGEPGQGVVR
jgi:hypothetical protein